MTSDSEVSHTPICSLIHSVLNLQHICTLQAMNIEARWWGYSVIDWLSSPVCPHLCIFTHEQFWSLRIAPFERLSIAWSTKSDLQKFTFATEREYHNRCCINLHHHIPINVSCSHSLSIDCIFSTHAFNIGHSQLRHHIGCRSFSVYFGIHKAVISLLPGWWLEHSVEMSACYFRTQVGNR